MKRHAIAVWEGGLKDGKGHLTTESIALARMPYGFRSRFENEPGTNPEELIAAAHAGCFAMAISGKLEEAGYPPAQVDARSEVRLEKSDAGWKVTGVHLTLNAQVMELPQGQLEKLAQEAVETCPISLLLNVPITLEIDSELSQSQRNAS